MNGNSTFFLLEFFAGLLEFLSLTLMLGRPKSFWKAGFCYQNFFKRGKNMLLFYF